MGIVITGGTVVRMRRADGADEAPVADVRIEGTRITEVGTVKPRPGDTVIDAAGCAVLPGLVQAHVHLAQALFRGMADDLPLLPWLEERIWPLEAAHDPASLAASAELGLAEMQRAGTTSILDMGTVHHHDAVMEAISRSGMRAVSGKAMMDQGDRVPAGLRETTASSLAESERLAAAWHGRENGRIRYGYAPRFILSCSEALFRGAVERAVESGAMLHSHVAEHADERDAVRKILGRDDLEALEFMGFQGTSCVLAHGVQFTDAEMKRVAEAGTRIAHCPSANLKLSSGIADVRAMLAAGIVVGIGADGAPCNNRMDPWTELRSAALLAKAKTGDASALAAREALALATTGGAEALGLGGAAGSIEAGFAADVIVVGLDGLHQLPGGDVYSTLVYSTTAADVRDVIVDGAVVVRGGVHQRLDEGAVKANARGEAKRVLSRAGLAR